MKEKSSSLVFFGSGPVAAESLRGILNEFSIELVVTKPRPAHHRKVAPVEQLAKRHGLQIAFADTKSKVNEVLQNKIITSPVGLIIDYGVIISDAAIHKFPMGIINSHFSILPRWRGPDPITYCLLQGDKHTGVSLMKIVPKLEEGPLIAQQELNLKPYIDTPKLTGELIALSNSMIRKYLPLYLKGQISPKPQAKAGITYSHKIKKSDGIIDWSKSADRIEREIRAYSGWPKSRTKLSGLDCIIIKAEVSDTSGPAGNYKIEDESLIVFAGKGSLSIKEIQPAGKNIMKIDEFLRGYKRKL